MNDDSPPTHDLTDPIDCEDNFISRHIANTLQEDEQSTEALDLIYPPIETESCELCGAEKREIRTKQPLRVKVAKYSINCPGSGCIGETTFYHVKPDTAMKPVSPIRREKIVESCTHCNGATPVELDEAVGQASPSSVFEFNVECNFIETTKIDKHHTSYDPEETIMVCSSCHSKIHHSDGFRDDLQPTDSRDTQVVRNE